MKKSSSYYRFKAPNTGNNAARVDCVTFMTMESRLRWRESQSFMPQSWEQEADLLGFPAQNETIQLCSSMGQPPDEALMTKEKVFFLSVDNPAIGGVSEQDDEISAALFEVAKMGARRQDTADRLHACKRERERQRYAFEHREEA